MNGEVHLIKLFRFLLLSATLLGAGGTHAQTDTATAENLLRKSGLWEQLGSIAPQVQAGFGAALSQGDSKPSAAEVERISRVIESAFSATRMRTVGIKVVAARLNARNAADLLRWYDAPVGRQIASLEAKASEEGADPQALMQQGLALLERSPPPRRQLLQALLVETRAAEALTQVTINTSLAAHRGAASALPNTLLLPEAELRMQLEAQRPEMLKAFAALALASFAKAYATLPTDHLGRYADFIKSRAGQDFNTIGIEALDAALTEAAAEFGRQLQGAKDQSNT